MDAGLRMDHDGGPVGGTAPAQIDFLCRRGRLFPRHISATLLDLEERGYLRIESGDDAPGDGGVGSLVVRRLGPAPNRRGDGGALAPFEAVLVDGLLGAEPERTLGDLPRSAIRRTVRRMDRTLASEARRSGWLRRGLRRLRRGPRRPLTEHGEQVRAAFSDFEKEVRAALPAAEEGTPPARWWPYAVACAITTDVEYKPHLIPEINALWKHSKVSTSPRILAGLARVRRAAPSRGLPHHRHRTWSESTGYQSTSHSDWGSGIGGGY